jgi:hypothetical protein
MFNALKQIKDGTIYTFHLKTNEILANCKILQNDTDRKLLTIEHLDNEISLSYSSISQFL